MNEMDLMKAMGNIKEEYIEEAAPLKEEYSLQSSSKVVPFQKYVKSLSVVAAGLVLLVSFGLYIKINQSGKTAYGPASDSATNSTTTTETADSSYDAYEEADGVAYEEAEGVAYEEADGTACEPSEEAAIGINNGAGAAEVIVCETMEDAMDIAGFPLSIDVELAKYTCYDIYAVPGEEIMFTLSDPEETFSCLIRKFDIKSEFAYNDNQPDLIENFKINDMEGVFRGCDGTITYAWWNTDAYQYDMTLEDGSLEREDWEKIISGIK